MRALLPIPPLGARLVAPIALALVVTALSFWIQADVGLNLTDEGLFWYVTTQTARGEVPVRDVRSFDPGRYYWGAAWLALLGDGIRSLRISMAVFQFVGLVAALSALHRVVRSPWLLGALGVILAAWTWPFYKTFESTVVLVLIAAGAAVFERPVPARFFAAGVVVGLGALVRIDHGLYGSLAFLLLTLVLAVRLGDPRLLRRLGAWGLGALVGYSPMLVMLAVVPGFSTAFAEYLTHLSGRMAGGGSVSLPLPVPWLWLAGPEIARLELVDALGRVALGGLFVALPLFFLATIVLALARRGAARPGDALLVASASVGAFYLGYAFSRPDLEHAAPGVQALLIGAVGLWPRLPRALVRPTVVAALGLAVVVSSVTVVAQAPYGRRARSPAGYVRTDVAGEPLWLNRSTADIIASVKRAAGERLQPDERLLVLPLWPGMYPILGKTSPSHEVYFMFPATEAVQRALIERLRRERVNWVVFADLVPDPRPELRFKHTHPLVWSHFKNDFEWLPVDDRHPWIHLLHRAREAS